jgi:CTP synthase (UTP-ammonia lyase)
MKYVLVTGGVVSGLGKGVTASSIGLLLQACGLRVTSIKIGEILVYLDCMQHSVLLVTRQKKSPFIV